MHAIACKCVEVRGQPAGTTGDLNSGHQAWEQAPLSTELSCWPTLHCFKRFWDCHWSTPKLMWMSHLLTGRSLLPLSLEAHPAGLLCTSSLLWLGAAVTKLWVSRSSNDAMVTASATHLLPTNVDLRSEAWNLELISGMRKEARRPGTGEQNDVQTEEHTVWVSRVITSLAADWLSLRTWERWPA